MFDILLVDDNLVFLRAMRATLSALPGIRIVGEAANGLEGVGFASQLHPDLVLMDITMPVLNGLEACKQILDQNHPPEVIFLSNHEGAEYRLAASQAGGTHLISKINFVAELIPLIASLVHRKSRQSESFLA